MSPDGREGDSGVNSELSVGVAGTVSLAIVVASDGIVEAILGTDEVLITTVALLEIVLTRLGEWVMELEAVVLAAMIDATAEADVVAKTAVRAGGAVDMTARAPVDVGPKEVAVFS